MFTRRHEQELAEIKAMTHDLGQRFDQLMEQLEAVKEAQDKLAARVGGDQPQAQAEVPQRRGANRNRGQGNGGKQGKRGRAARRGEQEAAGDGDGRKPRKRRARQADESTPDEE